jgi:hypothetical protein
MMGIMELLPKIRTRFTLNKKNPLSTLQNRKKRITGIGTVFTENLHGTCSK